MAPSTSKSAASAKDNRRKSSSTGNAKDSKIVAVKISPDHLRRIFGLSSQSTKEDTPMKDATKDSPASSTPAPAATASNHENGNASDSNPATPANGGTPAPSVMGPPDKKKGVKRSAAAAAAANGDGTAKPRGKPGPKKRQRMEDGTLEPARINGHRLGPKANQGAINAGLRALDRSGKPCRKWNKGGFRLKTFTGVEWEIKRWTAPPKPKPVVDDEATPASAAVSTSGASSKENKDSGSLPPPPQEQKDQQLPALKSDDNSNSNGDVEMRSVPSVQASSPAPVSIAAGA